jgi:hypothetical protein
MVNTIEPVNSGPFSAQVPFANEGHVQKFVEDHLTEIFGFEVIASSKRGGQNLFNIDILAINETNRPVMIECKWDLVGERALEQLVQYKSALHAGWDRFAARVNDVREKRVRVPKQDPILMTIGYRYDLSGVATCASSTLRFAYNYEDIQLAGEVLEKRRPGQVSIHGVGDLPPTRPPHPPVSKKGGMERRLAREHFRDSVQNAFWSLDSRLIALAEVTVKYTKIFARCRVRGTLFAEAVLAFPAIHWQVTTPVKRTAVLLSGRDEDSVYSALHEAYKSSLSPRFATRS